MAHCAVTAAQPTEGHLRRLGMCGSRRQVQFVLSRQGQTHPGEHRVGATAVQPRMFTARPHTRTEHPAPFRSASESRTTRRISFYKRLDGQNVNSLLQTLHWLPVEQRINYKLAVLTFKTQQTSSPQYPSQHISLSTSARNTRSSSVPLLCVPFRRTSYARRSFSTAAPLTWNSLPHVVLHCDSLSLSLSTFKSRLKTHLFSTAFC